MALLPILLGTWEEERGHWGTQRCMCCWSKICLICLFTVTKTPTPTKKALDTSHFISFQQIWFCSFFILSSPHLSLHQFQFIFSTAGARPALLHRMLGRRLQSSPEDQALDGHHDCHAGARNGGGESDGSHGGTSCALDWWLAHFIFERDRGMYRYHIGMFVRFWKDQSITMADPQKNNIHKIINVYLVSIYQLSIFAYLTDSKGMYLWIYIVRVLKISTTVMLTPAQFGDRHPRFQATELLQDEQRKEKRKMPKAKARFPKRRFEG